LARALITGWVLRPSYTSAGVSPPPQATIVVPSASRVMASATGLSCRRWAEWNDAECVRMECSPRRVF